GTRRWGRRSVRRREIAHRRGPEEAAMRHPWWRLIGALGGASAGTIAIPAQAHASGGRRGRGERRDPCPGARGRWRGVRRADLRFAGHRGDDQELLLLADGAAR